MSDRSEDTPPAVASVRSRPPPIPRISGTAIVGGVHLSTGNYGTAAWWRLVVSGLLISSLLAIGVTLTFAECWLVDRLMSTDWAATMWGLSGGAGGASSPSAGAVVPILSFVNFLIVLRLSSLSGYHAAEHKVVAAIERYGRVEVNEVLIMPRAHPRCGTVLLLGILPSLLIAYPLLYTHTPVAVGIAVVGWLLRYRVGYFIQQYLTTKPPTPAQLEAGLQAGRQITSFWAANAGRQVTIMQGLWNRGLPQLLIGVVAGQHLLGYALEHLHLWLDW
mgnify:CR=1 FL=1